MSQEKYNAGSGGDMSLSQDYIGTDSEYKSTVTDDESENLEQIANLQEFTNFCENCENSRNNVLELRRSARSKKGPPYRYDAEQVHVAKGPDHKKDPKGIKEALSGPEK